MQAKRFNEKATYINLQMANFSLRVEVQLSLIKRELTCSTRKITDIHVFQNMNHEEETTAYCSVMINTCMYLV